MIPLGVLASAHVPAAAGGATLAFVSNASSGTDAASYTFTGLTLGAPAATRRIHVVLAWRNALAITGLTIGGVTATLDVTVTTINSAAAIYSAAVPSGSTGTLAVTLAGTTSRLHAHLYASTGLTATPVGTDSGTGVPTTLTLTSAAGGFAIAIATLAVATDPTCGWAGATGDSSVRNEIASDTASTATTAGAASITATWSGATGINNYAAAAYAPA